MATADRVGSQGICRSIALNLRGSKLDYLLRSTWERELALARLEGQSLAGESNAPQDVFKTGAGLGPSNGLCAVGAIGGKRCQIIVDTGSNISIVHPDILKQAGISVIPTTGRLRTVTGETAPLQGRKTIQLTVGTFDTTCSMGG